MGCGLRRAWSVILLLSTMNGSSNWYCISSSSRRVRLVSEASRSSTGGSGAAGSGDTRPAEHDIDQLPGRAGVGVVGQVPDLPRRLRMLAENGQPLADVGDVGIGVRLVGVAENAGGLAVEGGREQSVAEVGLRTAAWPEVVGGAADGDLNPSGPVGGQQLTRHAAA